ncbi:hypothetical protein [Atopobium fossor]|uniref:hypothetical protein n=1 Tax=Atopobium fossor TaxID=39487 RepID=UPI0003F8B27A|nr:hypothetical protein [Atopobium fossor]
MSTKKPVEDTASFPQTTQSSEPQNASSQLGSKQKFLSVKKKDGVDRSFARAANEDDDGYDPWSDRPAKREPLFQADPWS